MALPLLTSPRKRLARVLLAALGFAAGGLASAAEVDLAAPITGLAIRQPPDPPTPGEPPLYGPTGDNPNWNIAQWSIPGEKLSPFAQANGGYTAQAPAARVTATPDSSGAAQLELSQDGTLLPCTVGGGGPREFDLFVSPNGQDLAGAGAVGWRRNGDQAPALSELERLTLRANVSYGASLAQSNKGCGVNQGTIMMSVILSNASATPPQTLFYQFLLGRVCGTGDPNHDASCRAPPTAQSYFFKQNPFGVDDSLPLAGDRWLDRDEERAVAVDVLPRLLAALESAPAGMERDPSRWRVTGFYAGQNIWGDVKLSTRWSGLRVVADTKQ